MLCNAASLTELVFKSQSSVKLPKLTAYSRHSYREAQIAVQQVFEDKTVGCDGTTGEANAGPLVQLERPSSQLLHDFRFSTMNRYFYFQDNRSIRVFTTKDQSMDMLDLRATLGKTQRNHQEKACSPDEISQPVAGSGCNTVTTPFSAHSA